uniref:Uncharacterized protein n=1 Tax=Ixodes ricinus TaxID=34613 RepID=A0A6B0UBZ4_IXORI
MVIRLTVITACFWSPARISSSVQSMRSASEMIPRTLFSVRCGLTFIWCSPRHVCFRIVLLWTSVSASTRRLPESFFALKALPMMASRHFDTRKGESLASGFSSSRA